MRNLRGLLENIVKIINKSLNISDNLEGLHQMCVTQFSYLLKYNHSLKLNV